MSHKEPKPKLKRKANVILQFAEPLRAPFGKMSLQALGGWGGSALRGEGAGDSFNRISFKS